MVQSLEEYVAQATNAYKPAQTALQNQLNSLSGQLKTANQQINKNYAQQQDTLNRNRNMAAESASLQAAGSGGSFGGSANIANRKYYDQTFVPAQTQMQTNQANELAQARQNYENQRTSLNSQMANLQSQANQQALQQYWAAVEAEREREAQERAARAAAAAANSANARLMDAYAQGVGGGGSGSQAIAQLNDFGTWLNNYSGLSKSMRQFYNSLINASARTNSGKVAAGFTKKIMNTPVYAQYVQWTKNPTYNYNVSNNTAKKSNYLASNIGAKLGVNGRLR